MPSLSVSWLLLLLHRLSFQLHATHTKKGNGATGRGATAEMNVFIRKHKQWKCGLRSAPGRNEWKRNKFSATSQKGAAALRRRMSLVKQQPSGRQKKRDESVSPSKNTCDTSNSSQFLAQLQHFRGQTVSNHLHISIEVEWNIEIYLNV